MKKKSSPGRDGSRGSNDRSRPATGRGKFTRNDNSGDRPARSEKKSPWDSFDNEGSSRPARGGSSERGERGSQRGERSAESGERRAPFTRGRSSSGDGEKRPYQRREESGESRAPFTRGRSSSGDGEKRPYKRRDDSGESRAPFTRGRSSSGDGEKRPYQRREEGGNTERSSERGERSPDSYRDSRGRSDSRDGEKRPYQRRDDSGESRAPFTRGRSDSNDGEKRPYKRRDENGESRAPFTRGRSDSHDGEKRPYQRREESGESRAPFTRGRSDSRDGEKRPYQKREESNDRGPVSYRDSSERSDRPAKRRDKSGPPSREDRHSRFEEKSSYRDRPSYGKSGGRRGAPRKRSASTGDDLTGEIRLNRFIGMAGICSRREADDLITAGVISVNGQVATELGMKVKPGDDIRYNGERIRNEKHVYLLLNKPKDYITTSDDPNDRKTVMELIAGACPERVYPVGRLDRNTVGLLLFTNDGDLARHLTHPSSRVKKIYQAELDKNFKVSDARRLQEGVELEDGVSSVDEISIGNAKDDKKVVGVELHSGKNRIVRRMFEALGYDVVKLDRVGFAGLTKKDLPRGRWRMLDEREVGFLKMMGNGKKKQAE
ncbi:MAG: RNA-binding S4 domain-containing protein [Bacteroidetes bacterium]|nr:RNA-binding S4 domain-containing protein [Bacteroidota bacterium]